MVENKDSVTLDMPLQDVETYLDSILNIHESLLSDVELVVELEGILARWSDSERD